jgi:hypothetical protein
VNKQIHSTEESSGQKNGSLKGWVRFLGVVFRIVIILGLLLLGLALALVIFTSIIPLWVLVIPIGLIVAGVILARIEYNLFQRFSKSLSRSSVENN